MKIFLIFLIIFIVNSSIDCTFMDSFHCKISTCRDFRNGLKNYPRRKEYEKICFDTVQELQLIPEKYGKCIKSDTRKIHKPCIYALAKTIKKCMIQLSDIPEREARYFCGHTPMKYCAVHVGLDGLPLDFVA